MLAMAVATSIDALAVGITFAFLEVNILPAVSFIALVTFLFSAVGVKIGSLFGTRFKAKAEALPQTPEVHLGKYAELRRAYLKKRRRVLYTNLKTSGKLTEHLAEIEQTARKMVEQTVAQMAKAEGVTEELKATDPLRWTGLINNLRHSAEELVLSDLIYA